MLEDAPVVAGPSPENLISKQLSFLPGIVIDLAYPGKTSPYYKPLSCCHSIRIQAEMQSGFWTLSFLSLYQLQLRKFLCIYSSISQE